MGLIDAKRYIPGTHTVWTVSQLARVKRICWQSAMDQRAWDEHGQLVQLLREERLVEATALIGDQEPDLARDCRSIPVDRYARSTLTLRWLATHAPGLFQAEHPASLRERWEAAVADAIHRADREYSLVLADLVEPSSEAELVGAALTYMIRETHQGSVHYGRTVETLVELWADLTLSGALGDCILDHLSAHLQGRPCHGFWIELVHRWPAADLHQIRSSSPYYQPALDWIQTNRPLPPRAKSARSAVC